MIDESMQRTVRKAISQADDLSRGEHLRHMEAGAEALAALRTRLTELDRGLGGTGVGQHDADELGRSIRKLQSFRHQVSPIARRRVAALVRASRRIVSDLRSPAEGPGRRSRPLFAVLPLKRLVPQDVHAMLDYAAGVVSAVSPLVGRSATSRAVGAALAGTLIGESALTDYRLSVAKVVPIEVHEAADYVWGTLAIASPFLFGYWRRDRVAGVVHVATGAAVILTSMLTDYRAARGLPKREKNRHFDEPESPQRRQQRAVHSSL